MQFSVQVVCGPLLPAELKEHSLRVLAPTPGRIKILNDFKNLLKFLFSSCYILKKCKIIDYVCKFPSEISVFINISQNIFAQDFLLFIKIPEAELRFKMFLE